MIDTTFHSLHSLSIRSMSQKTETETTNSTLPSHTSTNHPLHTHQAHKPTLPSLPQITGTYNHTPCSSAELLPQVSVPLLSISANSLPLSLSNKSTNHKAAGSHVTPHEDHVTSHASHMTLRKRDSQYTSVLPTTTGTCTSLNIHQDSSKLVRPKTRQCVVPNGKCSPPAGIRRLAPSPKQEQDEPVLRTGNSPARNLRFRPYSVSKT